MYLFYPFIHCFIKSCSGAYIAVKVEARIRKEISSVLLEWSELAHTIPLNTEDRIITA